MNFIDLFIFLWLISSAYRGFSTGFLQQALSFSGFILGLIIGGWLTPHLSFVLEEGASPLIPGLLITLSMAIILAMLGERLAIWLKGYIKITPAHHLNNVLGLLSGAVFVLVSSWLIASTITKLPFSNISLVIEQSKIVQVMNNVMPPAPRVLDKIGRLVSPQGFPQVFIDGEPQFDSAGPPLTAEVEAAAAKARDSMVRVEGFACGSISTGSGYVAAPNYLVTNAHVVAGVREPVVLHQGKRYSSKVMFFNPNDDIAVLRTDTPLSGPALALAEIKVPRATSVAVLGYPGGGSLRVSPGVVLRSQFALGRDIYNDGLVTREIYALQVNIEPGNSGGPVVLPDGRVVGVIFGEAVTHDGTGYALTSQEITDDLNTALTKTTAVSSGPCI